MTVRNTPENDRSSHAKSHHSGVLYYRCARCSIEKAPSDFGTRLTRGIITRQPYCKSCHVAYHRAWRQTEGGKRKFTAATEAYRGRHPDRFLARHQARAAVRAGRLTVGPCEVGEGCNGPIESHHDDYSKPLEVRWLCRRHHRKLDQHKVGRPRKVSP